MKFTLTFSSEHLDVQLQVEVAPATDQRQCPQILLYANTFKWLDFMKNTLTMVNRPVKRGRVFQEPALKRHQLSRHLRNIQLNLALPRFLISYWMSFSSSFGLRMISDSLLLTSSVVMNAAPSAADRAEAGPGVRRRFRAAVKVRHVSVQLEKAQIHLFGEASKPRAGEPAEAGDHEDSFFLGLSRLNYVRESERVEQQVSS